jgi:hypothetical protein
MRAPMLVVSLACMSADAAFKVLCMPGYVLLIRSVPI